MGLRLALSRWLRRLAGLRLAGSSLGRRGEEVAAGYLKRQGYQILARGDRSKLGELDLVARQGRTIVFVEVKTRQSVEAGHPAEAVSPAKQRRLTRLAITFLKRYGLLEHPARFDVIAVVWPEGQGEPAIEHFQDAFEAAGEGGFFS